MSRANLNNPILNLTRGGSTGERLLDANKMQIGLEYNYRTNDLNSPRGNDDKLNDYTKFIDITGKKNDYSLIYNTDLLSNKKIGFQNRIVGIKKHSMYLEAKSRALNINGISDPKVSEIVLKISLSIISSIPIIRPIGLIGTVFLAREEEKDKIKLAELQNKILTDVGLLNVELETLKVMYNSIFEFNEKGKQYITRDAKKTRSANVSNTKVFLGVGGLFLGVMYYLKKNKKK